jgi:hypothetical protein
MRTACLLVLCFIMSSCSFDKLYQMTQSKKKAEFDQFDFDDLAKLYMKKTTTEKSIEGIYSVSHLIVKKGKGFLSSVEREKVINRKENYGTVVIFVMMEHRHAIILRFRFLAIDSYLTPYVVSLAKQVKEIF